VLFALMCVAAIAETGHPAKPSGQTPPPVLEGRAMLVSHYEPTRMLRLAFVLTPPHPAEEHQFLDELQNRQSPHFHQFLSAEEWNSRFGPSVEDEQAVVDWAKSVGFTITHRYNDRLLVDVEAPAGVIEKALQITINNYQLPSDDPIADSRTMFANDRDPVLPANLTDVVQNVLGLNSFEGMRPASARGPLEPRPDYVPGPVAAEKESVRRDAMQEDAPLTADEAYLAPQVTTPPSGYWTPSFMWSSSAYDYGALMNLGHCCNPLNNTSGHSPRESSIAIAAFGDVNLTGDVVDGFATYFNLAVYASTIGIDGGYKCSSSKDDNCFETTLDTEWSLAMAQAHSGSSADTARVVVYEGSNYINSTILDVYNQMAEDAHARTMSTSWACAENIYYNSQLNCYNSTMQSADNVLSKMAGEGWTLIAASGDQGSTGNCDDALRVEFPSSDPNVIAAGGTELTLNSDYEVAWTGGTGSGSCNSNGGGGTGGYSEYFGVPSYQKYLGFSKRATPDLSLDAFYGHLIYYFGGWAHPGGTSDVAPMLAGFFAQENAYLLAIGNKCLPATNVCAPVGNANYLIYEEAQKHNAQHVLFYDIVKGCTTNDVTAHYHLSAWCAEPGYDKATGLGSANMLQLAWAINWETTSPTGIPYITFSGPATNKWYNTNQTVSWTIHDYNGGGSGIPFVGIAGETQGWDSLPADPSSEAHGGSGNSFYSGPQFPNGSTGCLSLVNGANGCSGGVSQGCHTAYARGWNNQGFSTAGQSDAPEHYGPICYDTVAPSVSISANPGRPASGWYNKAVTFTLSATDPGGSNASGIGSTFYSVNNKSCLPGSLGYCSVYSAPFAISTAGYYTVYSFTQDKAGNNSAQSSESVNIDLLPPVTTSKVTGTLSGGVYDTAVQVTLSATDDFSGVKTTTYEVDGGAATSYVGPFSISTLGGHTVTYWSVDVAGNIETTHSVAFTINSPTVAKLTVSPSPSVNGQSVTLTATIAATLSGTPTGTVTFLYGKTKIGSPVPLTGGAATLTVSTLPVGSDDLFATYAGAGDFLSSTATATQEVHETTTTTLKASASPATYGEPVTFTATVTPSISGVPTGSVEFRAGSIVLATEVLNSSGVATFTTAALAGGGHGMTAVYSGDSTYTASTSPVLVISVHPAASATVLKASTSDAGYGAAVTFKATITSTAGTPAGTVTFLNGETSIGTATLSGGVASLTTSSLPLGDHSITASYAGSLDFAASVSAAVPVETNTAATTVTLVSSLNPSDVAQSVTFTATVAATTSGTPAGTVTFKDGTTVLGSSTLSGGVATFTTSTLAEGTHSITAHYNGSSLYQTHTSGAVSQVVNAATAPK
jgi:hypothetical protein